MPVITNLALPGALSVALLLGTAQHPALAQAHAAQSGIQAELRNTHQAQAVALAEAAVIKAPQDGARRAELGQAYLRAGRFEAAAAALGDAVALGNATDRVTLSLALAQIACGQNRAALATLDRGSRIAPADLGLALALAGDPAAGIAVLTAAVRDGSASPQLRQNLAYAEALDGRWADAALTAGFDVPADQLASRLQQWAQSMQPGTDRARIARLLNVPMIEDSGMPAKFALNAAQTGPAVAQGPGPAVAVADERTP